jgi:hypothetical protein
MRVTSRGAPPGRAGRAPDGRGGPDRLGATAFLRAQSAALHRGLEGVEHRPAVGIALGAHDASHESWLALISALEDAGRPAARDIAALYTYHGRVVGFLERRLDHRLDDEVRAGLRALMSARLHRLTETAVDAVLHR